MCVNCKEFRDNVRHDSDAMLLALLDYWDLSISKHAPLTLDMSRPQIPLGRLKKKVHEFMSIGEPLVDDQGPYHDELGHGIASVTSKGGTLFSYILTPLTKLYWLWFFFFCPIVIVY